MLKCLHCLADHQGFIGLAEVLRKAGQNPVKRIRTKYMDKEVRATLVQGLQRKILSPCAMKDGYGLWQATFRLVSLCHGNCVGWRNASLS
ncbi:MAG: hypothetical protein WCS20_05590 [Alphaproteobacteria bacterium]